MVCLRRVHASPRDGGVNGRCGCMQPPTYLHTCVLSKRYKRPYLLRRDVIGRVREARDTDSWARTPELQIPVPAAWPKLPLYLDPRRHLIGPGRVPWAEKSTGKKLAVNMGTEGGNDLPEEAETSTGGKGERGLSVFCTVPAPGTAQMGGLHWRLGRAPAQHTAPAHWAAGTTALLCWSPTRPGSVLPVSRPPARSYTAKNQQSPNSATST